MVTWLNLAGRLRFWACRSAYLLRLRTFATGGQDLRRKRRPIDRILGAQVRMMLVMVRGCFADNFSSIADAQSPRVEYFASSIGDGSTTKKTKRSTKEGKKSGAGVFAAFEMETLGNAATKKAGVGIVDLRGAATDAEARMILDDFWLPDGYLGVPPPGPVTNLTGTTNTQKPKPTSSNPKPGPGTKNTTKPKPTGSNTKSGSTGTKNTTKPKPTDSNTKSGPLSTLLDCKASSGSGNEVAVLAKLLEATTANDGTLTPSAAKLAELQENARLLAAKQREATARASKQRRLDPRVKPRRALIQQLPPKWQILVQELEGRMGENEYTPITSYDNNIPISIRDFKTLLGRTSWLNDEIINGYIHWVGVAANEAAAAEALEYGDPEPPKNLFLVFNSFIWNKIRDQALGSMDAIMKRKKLGAAEDLLKVDTILFPINVAASHWTLGVVRPMARTIEYFDSFGPNTPTSVAFKKRMREWLRHRLQALYVDAEWTDPPALCAKQSNGYDCGVFVCTNAFCVVRHLDLSSYLQTDLLSQRRNIAAVLLNKGFRHDFAWKGDGL